MDGELKIFFNPDDNVKFVSPSKYENSIPKIINVSGNGLYSDRADSLWMEI